MSDSDRRWVVPTPGEVAAEASSSEDRAKKASWVKKLRMRTRLGIGRKVVTPPPIGTPGPVQPPAPKESLAPGRGSGAPEPATPLTPPHRIAPPPLLPPPRPEDVRSNLSPPDPHVSESSQAQPVLESGPPSAPLGRPRPIRIDKEVQRRRGQGERGDSLDPAPTSARRFLDGRCTACGRRFGGNIERATLGFVQHECGGRRADEEWRFDK